MISTVACVAVSPAKIAVVYDSEHSVFSIDDEFELKPHLDLVAIDEVSLNFLEKRNWIVKCVIRKNILKRPCQHCGNKKCVLTLAFLGWRTYMRKKGVTFKHDILNSLKSPRTKSLFIAMDLDRGCVVSDSGYCDGYPDDWLPMVIESDTVLTAIGSDTYKWLRKQVHFPIKEDNQINLNYPCKECNKRSCPLIRAYYGWRRQATLVTDIPH